MEKTFHNEYRTCIPKEHNTKQSGRKSEENVLKKLDDIYFKQIKPVKITIEFFIYFFLFLDNRKLETGKIL